MPPHSSLPDNGQPPTAALTSTTTVDGHHQPEAAKPYRVVPVWRNIIAMAIIHVLAVYGMFMFFAGYGQMKTFVWMYLLTYWSGLGITAGAHRLWCHRSYKATWQLRVILAIGQTIAGQNDIFEWCRDHRVHHKFSETDADPHNSKRGFFFAHMGWLLCKKHPDVIAKGKSVDMTDLWADPIVRFQRRFYLPLMALVWFAVPVLVPVFVFKDSFQIAALFNFARYVHSLHVTWLVNSWAHMWGWKPYDKLIRPVETSIVTYFTVGEGYHNYHHTFPWDYSASEYGWQDNWNPSTAFINLFAKIGWAYDLKKPDSKIIEKRRTRTGEKGINNRWTGMKWLADMVLGFFATTYLLWLGNIIRWYNFDPTFDYSL